MTLVREQKNRAYQLNSKLEMSSAHRKWLKFSQREMTGVCCRALPIRVVCLRRSFYISSLPVTVIRVIRITLPVSVEG
jgi:hypothetical protein